MKKIFFLYLTAFFILSVAQTPTNDSHWQLVWEDNFDFFDSDKWLKVDYAQHGEPQLYLDDNVSIANGKLVLEVNDNPIYCPQNPPTVWGACWPCDNKWYDYRSGWAETKEAYNTQYGYIESRIKMPYGMGFWPAFWTFIGPGNFPHTNAAEIDIFEVYGFLPPNNISTNIHKYYPDGNIHRQDFLLSNFNYSNTFHTYGIEWSPEKIIWFVDGVAIRVFVNHGIIDPVRIILNLAIQNGYLPNQSTPFPSEMLIDYVKVYELENDCNNVVNNCAFWFGGYVSSVKKNITIGGNGCSNIQPVNTNLTLRATDFIELKGNFEVPLGSELYIDVNTCY